MAKVKIFNIALVSAFVFLLSLTMLGFSASCEEMYDGIIRIRILANSDSKDDQELKLKVRDAVLKVSENLFSDAQNYEDALISAQNDIEKLKETACNTVISNGYDYTVSAELRDEFFDTRAYDGFTLPAGTYKTAVFTIGDGEGENWWCVLFPKVCVGACSGRLNDTLSDTSTEYAENSQKYVVKFKTVEIFQKIKKLFDF